MAYDEGLAAQVRSLLTNVSGLKEKKMFGGLAFLIAGNMSVGVADAELMVRLGRQAKDDVLKLPGVRPFDLTGKPMKGWIIVAAPFIQDRADLVHWVKMGREAAEALPPK